MRTVRLAYRGNDRTPVIYCIEARSNGITASGLKFVGRDESRP